MFHIMSRKTIAYVGKCYSFTNCTPL